MRKSLFSLLFIIGALFMSQVIVAKENIYLNNNDISKKDINLDIAEVKSGGLEKAITDRLGLRDIKDVVSITINKGNLNNSDFKFLSEEVFNLKTVDLSKTFFDDLEILTTFSNSKIESFSFPSSKKGYKLANDFFKNNRYLSEVRLNGVNSLGSYVFENTQNLRSVDLSEVSFFDEGIFLKSSIESVIFKQNFDLSKYFFKDTKHLTNIDISGANTIGEGVFYNSAVEFVKMPKSYALEAYTFSKTKNLKTIDMSGATRLGVGDFMESNIEEVIFPSTYKLPDFYFAKTLKLSSIDISNANEIGVGIFASSKIENIKFPNDFILSEGLLQDTNHLDYVDVSQAKSFKEAVFTGSSLSKIDLPKKFQVNAAMFGFMENLLSINLVGADFLGPNIFVKSGNNYDYYRKLFDGGDLVTTISGGIQSVIFGGGVIPSLANNSFANLNNNPPIVLLPKTSEWDNFSNLIMSKDNEIINQLRYDAFTYADLMISKNTSVQIGFINPLPRSVHDSPSSVKYQWYFNNKAIVNGNQSIFTIDNFDLNDEGFYRLDIIVDNKVYSLYEINLQANELAIDDKTLYKGFFLNEEVDVDLVRVLYVKDDIRKTLSVEDLEYDYNFSEVGNTSIKVTYQNEDLLVVADYPVKVANTLAKKIKLKKGEEFIYDPKIDDFEFVLTSVQKDFIEISKSEEGSEIIIKAKERYQGDLDFKFNERVGQIEIEVVRNLFWFWIGLGFILTLLFGLIIYLRLTRGMFKVKKKVKK
ncbi:MAG: leucine-rich repeat protein [Erysipelothrix sp.]|nr:leucine-rich repeat protein [Erysipelothrix sp.]